MADGLVIFRILAVGRDLLPCGSRKRGICPEPSLGLQCSHVFDRPGLAVRSPAGL